ncbi:hypothetical protein ACWIUD_01300 [Helicobacter sp. 23-1044]
MDCHDSASQNLAMTEKIADSAILTKSPKNPLDSAYIAFLDPDDFLEANALSHINAILQKHQTDAFCSNRFFEIKGENKGIFHYRVFDCALENRALSVKDIVEEVPRSIITTTCAFVFGAEILRDIRFVRGVSLGEDVIFCTSAALKSKAIYIDSAPIYNYRIRLNSALRDESYDKIISKANSMYKIAEFFYAKLQSENDKNFSEFYRHNIMQSVRTALIHLQKCGYKKTIFSKKDLEKFLPFMDFKRRVCSYFPRIYGLPKRIRLMISPKKEW